MVSTAKVAEEVYQISAPLKADVINLPSTTTIYLVVDEKIALIETGPTAVAESTWEGIRRLGYDPGKISFIIPTHIHLDHAGGLGYWAQRLPKAQVVLHKEGAPHMLEPSRLIASTKRSFGDAFESIYGPILPVPQNQAMVIEGEETIKLGRRELRLIHSPGHAPHHIAIWDSLTRGLFCGEALGVPSSDGSVVKPGVAPPSFDMEQFLKTIEDLSNLHPSILFYSHGTANRDVERSLHSVVETTKLYSEIVLEGMRAGEDQYQIASRIETCCGWKEEPNLAVIAYMIYFRRRNLPS
ncbi:MAG: MBL fold metallo-hydrolase [Chloroflexi bacterium]|nr:MBL fold metallo-hydrolase [Chloroflexota bacterium]